MSRSYGDPYTPETEATQKASMKLWRDYQAGLITKEEYQRKIDALELEAESKTGRTEELVQAPESVKKAAEIFNPAWGDHGCPADK